MENKVLVRVLFAPSLQEFDLFIPVNEILWRVKNNMLLCIASLLDMNLSLLDTYVLVNVNTGEVYENNECIYNTNIRNGTFLVLLRLDKTQYQDIV